ncbi:MAG: VWA domain-containing protein [Epsilonproteobacteria bacterium]|nr:VWA domain-containing protein [Campylobacterota bacterium]
MAAGGGIGADHLDDESSDGTRMMVLSSLWLWGLVIIPAYWWMARRFGWHTQGWLLFAVAMLLLALSRPVLSEKPVTVEEAGSDVILALDVSYSMHASDVAPSRLEAAKEVLSRIVHSDKRDRFGVLAHTTSAIVLSPLTKDTELLLHLAASIDESQIITKGTSVMSALKLARKMSHARNPLVLLLSDGGDELSYDKEAAFAKQNGLKVCIVMLASTVGSTLPSEEGSLKDENGHIVISSRNDAINTIAEQSGGKVIDGADVDAIIEWIERERGGDFVGTTTVARYQELFYLPALLALIALVMAYTTVWERVAKTIAPLLALFGLSAHAGWLDYPYIKAGQYDYAHRNYERSAQWFSHVDSPKAQFNRASALYKAGKYQEALGLYRQIRSSDPFFKSIVFYNIGNCHIRLGEFENARQALLKSLTLHYTKVADENLRAIGRAEEQKTLSVRREKNDKFSADENQPVGESKRGKEGGGSNMQSDIASFGAGDGQKKTEGDPRFSTSQGKASLSSKQYELINQRSVHETKPW